MQATKFIPTRIATSTDMQEGEKWLDTLFLPGYEVSHIGRVRNKQTRRIVNPELDERLGYQVKVTVPVDVLVALAFNPNADAEEKPFIIHKDGVRTNNHYLNLDYSATNPHQE